MRRRARPARPATLPFSCPGRAPQAPQTLDFWRIDSVSAASPLCRPAEIVRPSAGGARAFLASPPGPCIVREETHEIIEKLGDRSGFAGVGQRRLFRRNGEGPDGRRLVVELPGRALENRRSGDQEGARGARRQIHLGRRARVADQAADRRREPHLQGRRRSHHPRHGFGGDPSCGQEGVGRRHSGHRLRPPDREPERALHHLRQRRRRAHDGQSDRGREARRQLRLHQGRQGRPERRLPVLGHQGSARSRR